MDGRVFRVINTHLEPPNSEVRNNQAMEILDGPANIKLLVINDGVLTQLLAATQTICLLIKALMTYG
jgi:hypothetical protein